MTETFLILKCCFHKFGPVLLNANDELINDLGTDTIRAHASTPAILLKSKVAYALDAYHHLPRSTTAKETASNDDSRQLFICGAKLIFGTSVVYLVRFIFDRFLQLGPTFIDVSAEARKTSRTFPDQGLNTSGFRKIDVVLTF